VIAMFVIVDTQTGFHT